MSCSPNNCPKGRGTCGPQNEIPIWPSNTGNELLYRNQRLFNRDNHNHTEVLGEEYFGLPFMVPQNQHRRPTYINEQTGQRQTVPYSTDNVMHTDWVPYRLGTNLNTPIGSDSAIYFQNTIPGVPNTYDMYEGTPTQHGYTKWQDWLDTAATIPTTHGGTTLATKTTRGPDSAATAACTTGRDDKICSMTCTDWWTNRPVPPQGSLTSPQGGGGCPFNTVQSLVCHPCDVQTTYTKGQW